MAKKDRDSLSPIFDKMSESPGRLMMLVLNKWDKGISCALEGYDTTRTQIELLVCIAKLLKEKECVTQRDVVDFVHRDKNTVSEVMRTLEKKGYITRATSKGDMRAKAIVLTDEGVQLVEKAAHEVMLFDERFFPENSDNEELRKLLKKYL